MNWFEVRFISKQKVIHYQTPTSIKINKYINIIGLLLYNLNGGDNMAETKEMIIVIVGYILAIISPILGIIIGALLYFTQKENPFYLKHGKYIAIVAVAVWVIGIILVMAGLAPSLL